MRRKKRGAGHSHPSIDHYAYKSGLKEWNASYKVLFAMMALLTVLIADSMVLSGITLIFMGFLSCGKGKIKTHDYVRVLLIPAAFIVMSGIAILIQVGSGEGSIFSIPVFYTHLYLTKAGIVQAASLSLKALAAVSCLYLLTLSTPMGEIIGVLRRLHVPQLILELMHFIYRYIFILLEINRRQRDAVKSRLGYHSRHNVLRVFGNEMANLFLMAMNQSQSYYDALASRGYEGSCLFWEEKNNFTGAQLLWGIFYAALAAVGCFIGAVLHI